MKSKISKPEDLAKYVFKKLSGAKTPFPNPPIDILVELFECLFYTSMRTEENNLIKVTITLIDPENPDPSPPRRIVADRWQSVKFDRPLTFTIDSLVKLSKAADPWSSSLAVYYDNKGMLSIWGLIDQSVHYQSFLNYEADSGPEQPGLFQASITGIGSIIVLFDYEQLATLKQNKLVTKYLDVLRLGPVADIIKKNFSPNKTVVQGFINEEFSGEDPSEWDDWIDSIFRESLSRLLLRIQNYHHGGAIMFVNNYTYDMSIKYPIEYNRIPNAIINLIRHTITNYYSDERINDKMNSAKKTIPMALYLENYISEFEKQDTMGELKGAIRFIASQTCVDGLVIFNNDFVARGFGVVLKTKDLPSEIYISSSAIGSSLKAADPNHFGTRHRSVFSYCWKYKDSLGFVISQDGDIRAVTRVDDKLIVWENIKVQQFLRSNKIRRLPLAPKKIL
jgi:hypothetical protein